MKKFFAIKEENEFIFEGDELAHFNVLRCGLGEKVLCYGNDGLDYLCEVVSISKTRNAIIADTKRLQRYSILSCP